MLKHFFILLPLSICLIISFDHSWAQDSDLEELKELRETLKKNRKSKTQQISEIDQSLDSLKRQIEILTGWVLSTNGVVGLDFSGSNNWMSNDHPNASSSALALSINAFANRLGKRTFWRTSSIINLGWQSLDTNTGDMETSKFLNERTTDILQLSSLYGYKLNDQVATSLLADLNTSIFNFLDPGSLDFGTGITWTPQSAENFVAVINPLTFHFIFSDRKEVKNTSTLGLKLKATYRHAFKFGLVWGSTVTAFFPYRSPNEGQPGLLEYTWIQSMSFQLWKGMGIGINFGIRQADFEIEDVQSFHTVGLSYAF